MMRIAQIHCQNRTIVRFGLAMGLTFAGFVVNANAQVNRYELGLRVKRLEALFEAKCGDEQRRGLVLPFLEAAVGDFFRLRHDSACHRLDEATVALANTKGLTDFFAIRLQPELRLLDESVRQVSFSIAPQYGSFQDPERKIVVGLRLSYGKVVAQQKLPLGNEPESLTWSKILPEGDHEIFCRAVDDAAAAFEIRQTLSIVHGLQKRLDIVAARVRELDPEGFSAVARTVENRLKAIQRLRQSKMPETDLPVAKRLAEMEAWLQRGQFSWAPIQNGASCVDQVVLTSGRKTLPCRVLIPEHAVDGKATPLVIALHGMGGSENMFFEGYGAGKIVDLVRQRKWILVSPRVSLLGLGMTTDQIAQALEQLGVNVDRERILVVGHSMGAGNAMRLAGQGTALRAVAALGGGGSGKISDVNRKSKYFVAAGDRDFGRTGSKSLAQALLKNDASVDFRVYSKTEHLGIVQIALNDVFAFFDKACSVAP